MAEKTHSEGWITFAAIMAGLAGAANAITGFLAMFNLGRFSAANVAALNLYGWGLMVLIFGALQIAAAVLLTRRSSVGRIGALILASISILLWMLWLGGYPVAAVAAISFDVLVIYGLSVTGEYFE